MIYDVLLLITVAFAVARFFVPVSGKINRADIYKDTAHIWVGFLFGVSICAGFVFAGDEMRIDFGVDWQLWMLPIGLTVVEVVAFVVRRKQ